MTIERERDGELMAICNECGHEEPGETREFRELVDSLKELGWRIDRDDDGEWTHTCPDCLE